MVTCPFLRALFKACGVLLLWLVPAADSEAATTALQSRAKFCDARTSSIGKLIRQARAVGSPLTKRLRRAGIRFNPQRGWGGPTIHGSRHDDDQAIQNDAPATQSAGDVEIDLELLGVFEDAPAPGLFTRVFSPRSPRGPPPTA